MALLREEIAHIVGSGSEDRYLEAWSSLMDEVRQRPDQARSSVAPMDFRKLVLFREKSVSQPKEILDQATFVHPLIESLPRKTSLSLSGDLSKTFRAKLKKMALFDVRFKHADADSIKFLWQQLLSQTFAYNSGGSTKITQFSLVRSALDPVLRLFGFQFRETAGAEADFEVTKIPESGGDVIAVCEIKKIQLLDVSIVESSGEQSTL